MGNFDHGTTYRMQIWNGNPNKDSGDTTPCKMTGVTLHSHVHYKEIKARTCSGPLFSSVQ